VQGCEDSGSSLLHITHLRIRRKKGK